MRRNADAPGPTLILDRDGRALPFDGRRLHASIRRTLAVLDLGGSPTSDAESEDLSRIVGRFLESAHTERTLSSESLAGYVLQVLQAAGHEEAARLYAHTRSRREQGMAVRISDLIEAEVDVKLPPELARGIGHDVERGLAAAGLRDPGVGLLREWVDHALRQHGVVRGLSRPPVLGLTGEALRNLLSDGDPGLAAELRGSSALLSSHAMSDVFPSNVVEAHARGRLDLDAMAPRSRVHGLCVAPLSLPELRNATVGSRMAVLGELLRDLAVMASHEVRVLWTGPRPEDDEQLLQLEHHLALPAGVGARIVFCLDGADPELVRSFLARPSLTRTCRLRVHGPRFAPSLIPEIIARTADVEVARHAPRPGVVAGSCAVNLLRHALQTRRPGLRTDGEGDGDLEGLVDSPAVADPAAFLDAVEETAELAAAGMAAWHELGVGQLAAGRIESRVGQRFPTTWWLEPAGMVQARVVLLGAGGRARQNGHDLAVAVGERLRRGWANRWPTDSGDDVWAPNRLVDGPSNLELLPASPRAQRRFRDLDLPLDPVRRTRPSEADEARPGTVREPLGEGETFSHEGEADPAARGREVVLLRRSLGCADHAPAPRKASDAFVRESFIRAFLDPSLDEADIAPCA